MLLINHIASPEKPLNRKDTRLHMATFRQKLHRASMELTAMLCLFPQSSQSPPKASKQGERSKEYLQICRQVFPLAVQTATGNWSGTEHLAESSF